ncbi:ABC transporter ATP-binding protein [Patescibacteria group bacterium]|nr:ABC transporter ATP-binding protein [Patescibacteria group bacterium]
MSKIAIKLSKIGKKYQVAHTRNGSFWALKNVSLEINKGDRVGLIGPNGAGKTTLLRIIAGITQPTTGIVQTFGRVVALMDLEAGFHPDLTGEENVFLNGMLVGMNKKEIKQKFKQIVEFADIGLFIKAPFYTYSSGMKFRLAFAVAIASECDVMILDEIFLAGDFEFQLKTLEAIKNLQKKREITTVVCSHAPAFILNLADIFWEINKGIVASKKKRDLLKEIDQKHRIWTTAFKVDYQSIIK